MTAAAVIEAMMFDSLMTEPLVAVIVLAAKRRDVRMRHRPGQPRAESASAQIGP
jgi:hypothetical protein